MVRVDCLRLVRDGTLNRPGCAHCVGRGRAAGRPEPRPLHERARADLGSRCTRGQVGGTGPARRAAACTPPGRAEPNAFLRSFLKNAGQAVHACVMQGDSRLRLQVVASAAGMPAAEAVAGRLAGALAPSGAPVATSVHRGVQRFDGMTTAVPAAAPRPPRTFVPLHMPVNFVAKAVRAVPLVHEAATALQVAGRLLTNTYLHREIRETGGAYGGGAFFDATEGFFGFYSYRSVPCHSNTRWRGAIPR